MVLWSHCHGSVPVRVKSFCDASSWDAESWLGVSICYSREGRRSLHLPPAQLLQSVSTHSQQRWCDQVPKRRTEVHADSSAWKCLWMAIKISCQTAGLPLKLLVVSLVGMAAGQNHRSGETARFDPRYQLLTKPFRLRLQKIKS